MSFGNLGNEAKATCLGESTGTSPLVLRVVRTGSSDRREASGERPSRMDPLRNSYVSYLFVSTHPNLQIVVNDKYLRIEIPCCM